MKQYISTKHNLPKNHTPPLSNKPFIYYLPNYTHHSHTLTNLPPFLSHLTLQINKKSPTYLSPIITHPLPFANKPSTRPSTYPSIYLFNIPATHLSRRQASKRADTQS